MFISKKKNQNKKICKEAEAKKLQNRNGFFIGEIHKIESFGTDYKKQKNNNRFTYHCTGHYL